MSTLPQSVPWAPWLWDGDEVPLDDPAENFHEASRLHPSQLRPTLGARLLADNESLRASVVRATKRHVSGTARALPSPARSGRPFEDVVARRVSGRVFGGAALRLDVLAALLHAAYGVTRGVGSLPMRTTPSGGALYPLELYVVARDVDSLDEGVYHFDPLRRVLEPLRTGPVREEVAALSPYAELVTEAAVIVLATAVFWRTRFKYGQRGYRFALIEAGHVGQNLLLAAAAHDLAAVPVGGFYDRRADALVGADGLDEATVYAFAIGGGP